jgi:phenylalanyl-tRNA synthetase beta chain
MGPQQGFSMKVPLSWLREYVDFSGTPQELSDKLTFSGIEVEGIETIGADIDGVICAEIATVAPHPNADRLRLCDVDTGSEIVRVVCGASNFEVGDKAAFAPVGTVLPGDFKLKKAKIRGEASFGMLCAEDELGLSDEHDGIMILPREIEKGAPLTEVLGLPDTIMTLEITWNRPDCLSMLGIAREVAALCDLELKVPAVSLTETDEAVASVADVAIEDADGCPRYTARVLRDVAIGASPLWLQRRLTMAGVRPISNVVDITNYVMLECGQPLHAFDHPLLAQGRIVVRKAADGESIETLDGQSRKLTGEMLVIADGEKPVAVAGVMGGATSEISAGTTNVLLESAAFAAPGIHYTSRDLGLHSESSHRFECGVDLDGVAWASQRAAQLMQQHAGASVLQGVIDVFPGQHAPAELTLRWARLDALMGVTVPRKEAVGILNSLQISVVTHDDQICRVTVPSFRHDLTREADLIEEVVRMYGLERIPDVAPLARVVPDANDQPAYAEGKCRDTLIALGLTETMTYSFVSASLCNRFGKGAAERRVILPNPVSADYAILRDSLIPQLVESLGRNMAHQVSDVAFFEMGQTFFKRGSGDVAEETRVALGFMGKSGRHGMAVRKAVKPEESFLWAKGAVERLCAAMHTAELSFVPCDQEMMEEGACVEIRIGGKRVGLLGLLSGGIRHHWRMNEPVAVAELALAPLLVNAFAQPELKAVSAYPPITRDVAMILSDQVGHERIVATMRQAGPAELGQIELFDIFAGKGIEPGKRSLAYTLTYQSMDRTLTDEEANGFHSTVKAVLRESLTADLREG